jgi:MATE family multidrug resistance protein
LAACGGNHLRTVAAASLTSAFRHEARENLRLALPLTAAMLSFVGMSTTDTILAGRLSADALAAVAVGASVWSLPFVFFMGLLMAVSPIVAQQVGARRDPRRTGEFVRGALLCAIAAGLAWTAVLQAATDPVLDLLELEPAVRGPAEGYLRVLAFGGVPYCLCFVLRSAAEGHGLTRVPLRVGLTGLAYNAVAAWALMYGRLGLPALGAVGTAWATLTASCLMVAVYVVSFRGYPELRRLALWRRARPRVPSGELREMVAVGWPIAFMLTAETWLFIIGTLLMARFGADVVAAHQVAINFASLTFMVPLSIGLTTTVRVGHAAGAGLAHEVALRGRAGMLLGALFALASASVMALLPALVVGLYTSEPGVAVLAVRFLMFAALFQVADCVQATANGALRGVKDTRLPMIITVGAYWGIGAPLAAWLGFATSLGPFGIWIGFIGGLAAAAMGLSWRFVHHAPLDAHAEVRVRAAAQ